MLPSWLVLLFAAASALAFWTCCAAFDCFSAHSPFGDVQPLASHIVGELLLAELVLILLLGKGVVELLLRQAVLILFLLHLLVPRGVGAVGLVIAVVGVDVVPGVQQRTGQRAEAVVPETRSCTASPTTPSAVTALLNHCCFLAACCCSCAE